MMQRLRTRMDLFRLQCAARATCLGYTGTERRGPSSHPIDGPATELMLRRRYVIAGNIQKLGN